MSGFWEIVTQQLVAGVITIAGILVTIRVERKRSAKALADEKANETARWQRERRSQAYSAFRREAERLSGWMAMYTRVGLESAETPQADWILPLSDLRAEVELYGSTPVIQCAGVLFDRTRRLQSGLTGDMMRSDLAMLDYKNAIRADLDTGEPLPLPAWVAGMSQEDLDAWRTSPDEQLHVTPVDG